MTDEELDRLIAATSPIDDVALAAVALPRFDRELPEAIMSTSLPTGAPAGRPPESPGSGDDAHYVTEVTPHASEVADRHLRHRPRRRRVALVAAAAVLAAGGAALVTQRQPSDQPVNVGSQTSGEATTTSAPLTGATPPINQLLVSVDGGDALYNEALTILIKDCMAAQGFDWPAPSIDGAKAPSSVPPGFGEALAGTDAERLTVGPGYNPDPGTTHRRESGGTVVEYPSTGAIVSLPGGCTGDAGRQLAGGDDGRTALEQIPLVLVPIHLDALEQVKEGAAYAALVAAWHECMAAAGFPEAFDPAPLASPARAFPETPVPGEPGPDTPATAQSEACKTQTNFSPQVYDLLTPEQLNRLQAYPGLLDQVAAAQQHLHDEAAAVVAGQAPGS
jgi:hypothetical protein